MKLIGVMTCVMHNDNNGHNIYVLLKILSDFFFLSSTAIKIQDAFFYKILPLW